MKRKVNFTWKTADGSWTWEATHYEGGGIFFGKVTSPYVPNGEYGTWYVWQLQGNPTVRLTKGSQAELNKLLSSPSTKKKMDYQRQVMGDGLW